MIEVIYRGSIVARVSTPEDAAKLIRSLEAPATPAVVTAPTAVIPAVAPKPPEPAKPPSPWTPPITTAFVASLTEAGGGMIGAIAKNGPGTNPEVGLWMGKENGKGIGPAKKLVEKQAAQRGLPSPFVDLDGGKIGLTKEFAAAYAASK